MLGNDILVPLNSFAWKGCPFFFIVTVASIDVAAVIVNVALNAEVAFTISILSP